MILTWEEERQAEIKKLRERDKALERQREQARAQAQERVSTGQCDPIAAYNDANPIEITLTQYGYIQRGKKYLSPNSESGKPGAVVKGGKVLSHHSSDAGIGNPSPGGGIYADAFDLFCHFEHGGDYDQAIKAAGEMFTIHDPSRGDTVSLTKYNQREYMRQKDQNPDSLKDFIGEPEQKKKKPTLPPAKIITFDQIRKNNPQTEPLIKGFLNKGEGLLIHAMGGLGKSMLTTWLAIQAAMGKNLLSPLFGVFSLERSLTSLFIQTENSVATVNGRIRLMVGNDPQAMEALKFVAMPVYKQDVLSPGRPFTDPEFKKWLIETVRAAIIEMGRKIDTVWIDPLISFGSGDENDSAKMRLELDALNEICREVDVTPIIVHHDNRNGDYRGASAIFDWCRSMIGLKREFIGSERITDQDIDGNVTGTRVAPVPCIRMIHEKSNNMKMFDPILLRMNRRLNFEVVEESMTPEQMEQGNLVCKAITDLGGIAESRNELAKTYMELSGLSKTAATNHIKTAVNNAVIVMKSVLQNGKHAYKFTLPKD